MKPTREGSGNGARKWCAFRNNETVRMVLNHRLKEFNKRQLCRDLGVDYMNFQHYLNGSNPRAITQYDLWRLANFIGVRVEVKIELK